MRGVTMPLMGGEDGQERLLGDLDRADGLHPLLAGLLLLQQLPLPGDVAPVALGRHVLHECPDRLPRNYTPSDGRLQGNLEELTRNLLPQNFDVAPSALLGDGLVAYRREGVDVDAVDHDVHLDEVGRFVAFH